MDSSVLIHLAEQFDVLGYKGWALADTEEKQRNLIKSAVSLHKKAGTPSAIKEALEAVGIEVNTIVENPCLLYDGFFYNGSEYYNRRRWDRFIVDLAEPVDPEKIDLINGLIEAWKNARSNRFFPLFPLQYNGSFSYDGLEIYDGKFDELIDISNYQQCIANGEPDPDPPECIPQLQLRNELQLTNELQLLDFFCD
ncbi:Tail protein I [Geminocystis sp. NIES-3709]|nr:Tail protein I [Geminocystis sp. NIES-3709]